MNWLCLVLLHAPFYFFFFFNDTATTEIYTLSLHDALPISAMNARPALPCAHEDACAGTPLFARLDARDRKSTRLNSSHGYISYAVFCLKKKKNHLPHIVNNNILQYHTVYVTETVSHQYRLA